MLISRESARHRHPCVWFAVVVSALLHVLLLYGVANLNHSPRPRLDAEPQLILHLLPAPAPPVQSPPAVQQTPRQPEKISARHSPSAPAQSGKSRTPTAVSIPAAPPAPDKLPPTSPVRPSGMDMIEAAKRDVGEIDRELRKALPPSREPIPPAAPLSAQQKLAKGIAAAARPRGTFMEDLTLPNGQRVTKVTGPLGSYCVTQISVGDTKGEDIMHGNFQAS
jgi:hypothetical protein